MFSYQRITAASFAVGIIAVLSGCASSPNANAATPGSDVEAAQAMYEDIVADIYGTPAQRAAGEERGWLQTQGAIANCVREAGTVYPVGPFNAMTGPDKKVAPGDLVAFAPVGTTFGVGEFKKRWAAKGGPEQENNPVYLALKTPAERDGYMEKVENCQGAATQYEASYQTPKTEGLSAKFIGALSKVMQEATPDANERYVVCMRTAGVPVESFSDLANQVAMVYPPVVYDKPKDITVDPGWDKAVAFEAKAAEADASCRTDIVTTAMTAALPGLTTFAAENKAVLDANAAQWLSIESEVATLRAKLNKN